MSGRLSIEQQQRVAANLLQQAESEKILPDIGIDDSILKFSGLDSASVLKSCCDDLVRKGPGILKDLCDALSDFTGVPAGVGLGALIISSILDLIINKPGNDGTEPTLDVVRRVFAEEKASGVRDTVDGYIKRFRSNMNNPEELLEYTKRMEEKLSRKLTNLSNSMLQDNQMSSRSMKHWVNGAAFHLLMLVHVARLKMAKKSGSEAELNREVASISSIAEVYENDMRNLLAKYETFKRSTIYTEISGFKHVPSLVGRVSIPDGCSVKDTELNKKSSGVSWKLTHCGYMTEPYVNYMFTNWKVLKELREYFPGAKQNLREKIMQNSEFNIQKFLPKLSKN